MKVTQVHITPRDRKFESTVRLKYQMAASYLTLPLSTLVANRNLNLGAWNRIVFEEGCAKDLTIAGDRAFAVRLDDEFTSLESLSSADIVHRYFARKYLEGFERFDEHFELDLTSAVRAYCDERRYSYEKQFASRKIAGIAYAVVGVYT